MEQMVRELILTTEPIDEAALVAGRKLPAGMGAVATFVGVVRPTEAGATISGLEYESFRSMAEHQFELLFQEMERRWPVGSVRLVHRLGNVKAGEASLWVEVTGPHRGEVFAACQWLVEEMKRVVPIWKKVLG
jgi:molybdopterin synthase catalytic subunit